MRARNRIYHVDCFRCVTCQRRLVSGDEFALRRSDSELVCGDHYDSSSDCGPSDLRAAVESPTDRVVCDEMSTDCSDVTAAHGIATSSSTCMTKHLESGVSGVVNNAKKKPSDTRQFSTKRLSILLTND